MLVSCSAISKAYTGIPLFEGINLVIGEGERLGIIGPNGSGKSTLLKIIGKELEPDQGIVAKRRELAIAWVTQDLRFDEQRDALAVLQAAAERSRRSPEERRKTLAIISGQAKLSEGRIAELSGGMRKRLALACAFVQAPDLLLLDEPTNHLDIEGILWLEDLLRNAPFAWAAVTHDRWFLRRTAGRILELSKVYPGGWFVTDGGYDRFLEQKAAQLDAQQRERESLANKVRRETEWLRRGPKARTTKAKARIDQAYELMEELGSIEERLRESSTEISFGASERKTRKLIEVKNASKGFDGKPVFEHLNLLLSPGLRIGILGRNGSGKTTLLKILAKEMRPDHGSVAHATDLQAAFFDQYRAQLNPQWTLKRALCEHGDSVVFRGQAIHVVGWAKRFQFKPEQLETPVALLSGGEQARLAIARLMLSPADMLLLDEPTNDLDIPALESLEESLFEFSGAIVLVTHDRYLIDRVCHGYIGLDSAGGAHFYADYEQWERQLKDELNRREKKPKEARPERPAASSAPKKLSYLDQRELDRMEEAILASETEVENRERVLHDASTLSSLEKMRAAAAAWEQAKQAVDALYSRWEELERKRSG